MKIVIVDFNDSFTWNIFSTLKEIDQNLQVEIVHWLNFEVPLRDKTIVILGPGPGHPNEYQKFIPKISKILSSSLIYLIGICLGHQLIAKLMGMEIVPSASLVHGQTEQITLPLWDEVFQENFIIRLLKFSAIIRFQLEKILIEQPRLKL